jgi:hypothetical protein
VTALAPNPGRFQKKYILARVLPASGIYTSAEAIKLIEATGLSYRAAKGNVNRSKADDGIWCTDRLRLEANGRLFANVAFVTSPDFPRAVIEKLSLLRPGLARALIALLHKEVLLVSHIARLLASPVPDEERRSSPTLERELNALLDLPFLKREGVNGPLDRISLKKLKDPRKERALAQWAMTRQYLEEKLTYVVLDYFARMNMVAWRPADRQVDDTSMASLLRSYFLAPAPATAKSSQRSSVATNAHRLRCTLPGHRARSSAGLRRAHYSFGIQHHQ